MYDRAEILRDCFGLGLAILEMQRVLIPVGYKERTVEHEVYKVIAEELDKPKPDLNRVYTLIEILRQNLK